MKINNKTLEDCAFTNEEIGQNVAFFLKWNGNAICEAFLEALTDSNFHTLRKQLEIVINKELGA
jgi:hypothetical protein